MSSCYAHFWGALPVVPGMTKVPLEEVVPRLIMKYSPEDPVLGQPMERPIRKACMRRAYSSMAHSS